MKEFELIPHTSFIDFNKIFGESTTTAIDFLLGPHWDSVWIIRYFIVSTQNDKLYEYKNIDK